jgi:hypothetical protein
MVLLKNVFEVQKSLFILILNNEICNAFMQLLQQYIILAKRIVLVSDSMLRLISNALNSYFGLRTIKELNVYIRPSDNFVLIGNQPFFLWVTATTCLLRVGWFIQNLVILTKVARYERT